MRVCVHVCASPLCLLGVGVSGKFTACAKAKKAFNIDSLTHPERGGSEGTGRGVTYVEGLVIFEQRRIKYWVTIFMPS